MHFLLTSSVLDLTCIFNFGQIICFIPDFEFNFPLNPSNKTAKVGDTVELKCGPPHSYPPRVTIHWYHNYQEIQPAAGITINQLSGSLTLASVKKSDEGKYFCSGTNTVSQETRASAVAYVTVNGKYHLVLVVSIWLL